LSTKGEIQPVPDGMKNDLANRPDATMNYEGGLAFKTSPEMELYLRSSSTLVGEPKFYDASGEGDNEILRLVRQVAKTEPEFVLKLAAYCRNDIYLRTLPIMLLVESTAHPATRAFVRRYTPSIVRRADELAEAVAAFKHRYGDIGDKSKKGMLSNPLKRGLADAFQNFNEYQLSKYDRDGEVKLRDVLRIVHPKPRDKAQAELWKRVIERSLPTPRTWETVISTRGSTKENWESILPDMPFMATLRNLRNLLDKKVDMKIAIERLTNKVQVLNSKQFPYRFFSAYRELQGHDNPKTPKVLEALEIAMDISVENVPEMKGMTAIFGDNSGSMDGTVSAKSKVKRREVAGILAAMSHKVCEQAICGVFGEKFRTVHIMQSEGIIGNAARMSQTDVGHSTNAYLAINYLLEQRFKVDRILLFSDMQCYDSREGRQIFRRHLGESLAAHMAAYRRKVNPKIALYSFDLAGYGTAQFPQDDPNVALLSGWSDRILQFIPAFEQRRRVLDRIRRIDQETYLKRTEED